MPNQPTTSARAGVTLRRAEHGRASLGGGVWITQNRVVYRDDFRPASERWVVFRPPWLAYNGSIGLIDWIHAAIEADGGAGYRTLREALQSVENGRRRNG